MVVWNGCVEGGWRGGIVESFIKGKSRGDIDYLGST